MPSPPGGPECYVSFSEKDPGYPYLAVAFQALGIIRLAPLSMTHWVAWACVASCGGGSALSGRPAVSSFCGCRGRHVA
jgi:hypothetical protein